MTELLTKAQSGDMDAFAALFEPLRSKLMAVACRYVGPVDAEDVVMDTFLKAWHALPQFRARSSPATWLIRIARNVALDLIRRRSSGVGAAQSMEAMDPGQASRLADPCEVTAAEEVATADDCRMCRNALERMDARHRDILLLRYRDELEYGEMAAALGISIGTVMSRLFNARRKIVRIVAELDDQAPGDGPKVGRNLS